MTDVFSGSVAVRGRIPSVLLTGLEWKDSSHPVEGGLLAVMSSDEPDHVTHLHCVLGCVVPDTTPVDIDLVTETLEVINRCGGCTGLGADAADENGSHQSNRLWLSALEQRQDLFKHTFL